MAEALDIFENTLSRLGLKTDFDVFLMIMALLGARILSALTLTPFFGGKVAPAQARAGLAVILALLIYPSVPEPAGVGATSFVALLVKEVLIGFVLGLLTQFVFAAVEMAGALVDFLRGAQADAILAPQFSSRVSPLGQLKLQAALALALTLNGHLFFIRGLERSFGAFPIWEFLPGSSGVDRQAVRVAVVFAQTFQAAVEMAAPAAIAILLIDAAFGVLQRLVPSISVEEQAGRPLKMLLGIAALLLSLGVFLERFINLFWTIVGQGFDLLRPR